MPYLGYFLYQIVLYVIINLMLFIHIKTLVSPCIIFYKSFSITFKPIFSPHQTLKDKKEIKRQKIKKKLYLKINTKVTVNVISSDLH